MLQGGQSITAAGSGTLEDGAPTLAGARNAAAEAGIVGNKDFSLEALPDLGPSFIVVAEPDPSHPYSRRACTGCPLWPACRRCSRIGW